MHLKRRQLLLTAATALVVRPAVDAIPAAPATPLPLPQNDFGYSLDGGERWATGFGSHAEALEEAVSYAMPGDVVTTGIATPLTMQLPGGLSLIESVADALLNGGGNLGDVLAEELQRWNEDSDYEGEFANAVAVAPLDDLPEKALVCVQTAFRRLGWPDWADRLQGAEVLPEADDGVTLDDAGLEALVADAAVEQELLGLLDAWARAHNLQNEIRALHIREERDHTVQEM